MQLTIKQCREISEVEVVTAYELQQEKEDYDLQTREDIKFLEQFGG